MNIMANLQLLLNLLKHLVRELRKNECNEKVNEVNKEINEWAEAKKAAVKKTRATAKDGWGKWQWGCCHFSSGGRLLGG